MIQKLKNGFQLKKKLSKTNQHYKSTRIKHSCLLSTHLLDHVGYKYTATIIQ